MIGRDPRHHADIGVIVEICVCRQRNELDTVLLFGEYVLCLLGETLHRRVGANQEQRGGRLAKELCDGGGRVPDRDRKRRVSGVHRAQDERPERGEV